MTKTRNQNGEVGPVLAMILAVIGLIVIAVGAYAVQWYTADARGALDQREKTVANGDYRIANYDWFYRQCGDVQAQEDQIQNIRDRKASSDSQSGFTPAQKAAILLAHQNARAEMIREYNAKATATGTSGQFRASDLPFQLNLNGDTTCAAS